MLSHSSGTSTVNKFTSLGFSPSSPRNTIVLLLHSLAFSLLSPVSFNVPTPLSPSLFLSLKNRTQENMKFATTSTAALAFLIGASTLSSDSVVSAQATAPAALSAACNQYLTSLSQASNPLARCRVYTALGFPQMTYKNDHDTPKLQKTIVEYCSQPACTADQYAGVYKDLQTHCATDMVAANQNTLGVTMYMW